MITLAATLILAAGAGLVLGGLHFGTLLMTTRAIARSRRPGLLLLVSTSGRVAALLVGLWLVGAGDWRRVVAALVGVIAARACLVRRARGPVGDAGEAKA